MDILVSVVLPLILAFIMFTLGLGLTMADFLRVGQRPLAFMVGALNQLVLLPIITFLFILLFEIKTELAVGFMILSACPGGVTSNIISKLAKGDVALSVSLTAVMSLVSVITVPLILSFAMQRFMDGNVPNVDIAKTAITMFSLTVIPVSIGLAVRNFAPNFTQKTEVFFSRAATILFVLIIIAALAGNWGLFVENALIIGPALIGLMIALSAIGFFVPLLLGRNKKESKTISIETGFQNGTLGIAVAAIIVGSSEGFSAYALPSAVYGIGMYLVVIPLVLIYRRMD